MLEKRQNRNPFSLCIFPGYKWCGPGCSGPGRPINEVDTCCMRHDQCLKRGRSSCKCDFEFMNCLKPKMNPRTQMGRNAIIMYRAMKLKTSFFCGRRFH
ncbi:phospholipase [Bacillus massilinigeriensis]|uniref:phospholipase n=1 Tax=Bacillus massilionigeriensis TaxID=1805475 RepID=UPI00096B07FC|nr:phospholipase [Bacillus massilionigeriensis]